MTLYYSASTGGFYDKEINGDAIPVDAVEILDDDYRALFDAQAQGSVIQADANGYPVAVAPVPPTLDQVKLTLCAQVDATADATYVVIGGPSPGRLAEYKQAKADADAFKAAGYTGTVPDTIACWAEAKGWTAQQACDGILSTAASWDSALEAIRRHRLIGKKDVNAATDAGAAKAAADTATANIMAVPASL